MERTFPGVLNFDKFNIRKMYNIVENILSLPSSDEVMEAIKKLKNDKSSRIGEIQAELLNNEVT